MSTAHTKNVLSNATPRSEPTPTSGPLSQRELDPSSHSRTDSRSGDVTRLLLSWSEGDAAALEHLTPIVYDELRRLSRSYMRRERSGHTLQSTAVVHEAYLRLIDQHTHWKSRAHFFAIAAQMMRRILVDHAKAHNAEKRGAGATTFCIEDRDLAGKEQDIELLEVDEVLDRLARIDPQRARIVEMRFFGGLSNDEIAAALGISSATVQRIWTGARVWLHHELKKRP